MANIIGNATFGDVVSFEVIPSSIIGTNYKHVKLIGVIDASTADKLGLNPYTTHARIYPTLNQREVKNDANSYLYAYIEFSNGAFQAVGLPWIKANTVLVHTSTKLTLQIENVSAPEQQHIHDAIAALGFTILSSELS